MGDDERRPLELLLRTGQVAELSGELREVESFRALEPAIGSGGAASGYDDAGHVTVLATVTDNTVALLEPSVP